MDLSMYQKIRIYGILGGGGGACCVFLAAHRLGCSTAHGIFVPPSGIRLMSPALAGRFFTTAPPGKPRNALCLCSVSERFSLLLSQLASSAA